MIFDTRLYLNHRNDLRLREQVLISAKLVQKLNNPKDLSESKFSPLDLLQIRKNIYKAIVMAISLEEKVRDVNTDKDIHGRKILHDFITAEFMF